MPLRRFTILGCASSPGVPRVNGDWGACDPSNPKNRRTRAALLVEQFGDDGGCTTVVIDTGPDFREQMIAARVQNIDGVVYTHAHADHVHGIDDLRGYFHNQRSPIPIYADQNTMDRIREGFAYCLETPPGSAYPPIVTPHIIETPDSIVTIEGEGGAITLMPLLQVHGSINSLGFRIGDVAYCPDVSDFPEATAAKMKFLDLLIIDALQERPHPSHLSIGEALDWISRLNPTNAALTHMHVPLDYDTVMASTPANVVPSYDGLIFEFMI